MTKFKLFGFAIALFALGSCSLNAEVKQEEIKEETDEYTIDVVESFIDCKDNDNYRLIEPVNNRMGDIVDSLIYDTKSEAISTFSAISSRRMSRPSFKYELMTRDTIFNLTEKLISVRITVYSFSGGAHGMTNFYAVNYSPAIGKFIGINDLFDRSKEVFINSLIQKYFNNSEKCFTEMPTLELATTVNVSSDSVLFTYEHYLLGPYSCGSVVVEVPLKEIKDCLKL